METLIHHRACSYLHNKAKVSAIILAMTVPSHKKNYRDHKTITVLRFLLLQQDHNIQLAEEYQGFLLLNQDHNYSTQVPTTPSQKQH